MRKYVFPWHKEIVKTAHGAGKPAVLHSCGWFEGVIDDILDIGYDGRHSYEDNILPVERACELLHGRIAVLGGIDMHFLCTASQEEIKRRARALLARARQRGGYALGSGNSIPGYCPTENYLAMISVVDGE
jgi:uroporphyrinogen decarboxylase